MLCRSLASRLAPTITRTVRRKYATVVDFSPKPPRFGQPTPTTHPHLLKPGELTPGISKTEYFDRRKRLMDGLVEEDSVVVCLAGAVKYASGEIFYRFRQSSDFWYLTGFQEPESALVLEKAPSTSQGHKATLFVRPKDAHAELWDGARTGVDAALDLVGIDQVLDIVELPAYLQSKVESSGDVWTSGPQGDGSSTSKRKKRTWSNLFSSAKSGQVLTHDSVMAEIYSRRPKSVRPLGPRVLEMRSIKSKAEQRLMLMAGQVSGTAHGKTMRFTEPDKPEADLAAHFEYLCALKGSQRPAYVPVVASGGNALRIHYTANDQIMRGGELVLMDAGCELHGYASDITRTWPVSGKFTEPQKDLYQAVLNTLKICTQMCTEDANVSLYEIHRASCNSLLEELKQIGFTDLTMKGVDQLYPHFVSHPIGIDLHESGEARNKRLTNGMVVTIEPGVYVPPDPDFPKAFHNMGIRLEDDILVKTNNFIRLTANAPLEIVDVEGACQGTLGGGPY